MSDGSSGSGSKIGGPASPPPNAQYDIDEGFADDLVGAKLKAQEEAKRRAVEGRRRPRESDRTRGLRRVEEAATFQRSQQEDDISRRERKFRESDGKRTDALATRRRLRKRRGGVESVDAQEELVGELVHEIQSLLDQVDLHGGLDAMEEAARRVLDKEGRASRGEDKNQVGRLAGSVAELVSLNEKLRRAETQVKQHLQQLLTGATGLALLSDPRLTLRRLLDRIQRWPSRIRPGVRPSSDEELDAFIAWVFEPPEAPAADEGKEYDW